MKKLMLGLGLVSLPFLITFLLRVTNIVVGSFGDIFILVLFGCFLLVVSYVLGDIISMEKENKKLERRIKYGHGPWDDED